VSEWLSSAEVLPKVKAAVAMAGCLLLYLEARRPRAATHRTRRWVAAILGVVAIAAYFQFGPLPGPGRYHAWEMYHYYVGAKHARELGYTRLYECAAVAEAELGFGSAVRARTLRNLRDDSVLTGAEALEHADECRARFSAERWRVFRSDVAWFRGSAGGGELWTAMQNDHGFNPSPVWVLAGHALASLAPPSHHFLGVLALIDVVLLGVLFALLGWAFGYRVAALAAVFLGTQAAAEMPWTGGAFLRMDWLLAATAALCLMRKRHFFWAGAALAYASLLRVFPVLLWAGPAVLAARQLVRHRRLAAPLKRLALGGAVATALLVLPSLALSGPQAWPEFMSHTRMHATTPISNHMSLRTLFSAAPETRLEAHHHPWLRPPVDTWTDARRDELAHNRTAYLVAAAAMVIAFAYVVMALRSVWLATGLGTVLIVTLTDPSCYYYAFFLLAVPVARARRSLEMAFLGLAGVSQLVISRYAWVDDRFWWLAGAYVAFAALLLVVFARPPRPSFVLAQLRPKQPREAS